MINKKALVLYKNFVAEVIEKEDDKFLIRFCTQAATSTGTKSA